MNKKNIVTIAFLLTPIIASIISGIHIVHFFALGNPDWMSYFLAITFEIGSIASFIALSVMDRIKKSMVIFIFVILFFMQLIGNVYFSLEYVNQQLAINSSWLSTFSEMCHPLFGDIEQSTYKFILAITIGVPIPLVSLSFLKSLVDYLNVDAVNLNINSAIPESISSEPVIINNKSEEISKISNADDTALYSTVQ